MSFEQVKAYLAGLGLNALEFDVSSATVELAAVAPWDANRAASPRR